MRHPIDITPAMRGKCLSRGIHAAIAVLAECQVIEAYADSDVRTRGGLEERFHSIVLDEDLPRPEMNGTLELSEQRRPLIRDIRRLLDPRRRHSPR